MNILVTGFEPFGGSLLNPSELVVKGLAEIQPVADSQIFGIVLPVDGKRAAAELIDAIREYLPEAVVCFGQARGRSVVSIERIAINWLDYRIPDNQGSQIVDEPVVPGGPAAYFTTLPIRVMQQEVERAGVPVEICLSAGSFLCNQVMYSMLHFLAENAPEIRGGFIHLPILPEQAAERQAPHPSMALATSLRGVTAALNSLAGCSRPG